MTHLEPETSTLKMVVSIGWYQIFTWKMVGNHQTSIFNWWFGRFFTIQKRVHQGDNRVANGESRHGKGAPRGRLAAEKSWWAFTVRQRWKVIYIYIIIYICNLVEVFGGTMNIYIYIRIYHIYVYIIYVYVICICIYIIYIFLFLYIYICVCIHLYGNIYIYICIWYTSWDTPFSPLLMQNVDRGPWNLLSLREVFGSQKPWRCQPKNRGKHLKMDGEFIVEHPMNKWMIWEEKPNFWKYPYIYI